MKRVNQLMLSIIAAITATTTVSAQSTNEEAFDKKIYESFVTFYKAGVPEKIYIQSDKPYYSAGENIWFKGHLVNTITHTNSTESKFIYVELTDRRDSLFTRVKIQKDEFGFHNAITLPNNMAPGEYTLTAYTKWMQNWSPELFCHKKIEIANPIDDAVALNASYTRKEDGITEVKVKIQSAAVPAANASVVCSYMDGDKIQKANIKIGQDKSLTITLPAEFSTSALELVCSDEKLSFNKTIYVPQFDDKIDLQFFPEGGVLLAGNGQTVAFKAIGVDGLSRDIEGELFGEQEGKILDFKSEYKGMGRLMMMVQPGDKYYVIIKDPEDSSKTLRFDLPEVQVSGAIIKCAIMGSKLMCQAILTEDLDPSRVGVIIHSRGKVINTQLLTSNTEVKSIPLAPLPEGILTLSLVNIDSYTTIAERRVFITPHTLTTTITPDKSSYKKRSLVRLKVSVRDGELPAEGAYAVSVTDQNAVDINQATETIESNLLMSSDLKGYVENPSSYFTGNTAQDYARQELVMLTHGWRRFSLDKVLHGEVETATIPMEKAQVVRGYVKGFFGNKAKNARLVIFNPKTKFVDMFPLGNTHKFELSGFDYPDSTTLVLQAIGKGGSNKSMTLYVEDELFNTPKYIFPQPVIGREQNIIPMSYLTQSMENYYYQGGMKVINLEAVTVVGQKKVDQTDTGLYSVFNPTNSMSGEQLAAYNDLTVFDVLQYFPEIQVRNNEEYTDAIFMRGYDEQPVVFVNELETDIDFIRTIGVDQVTEVQILSSSDAVSLGTSAESGAIVIKLKEGATLASSIPNMPSMVNLNMLGYKRAETYYQPKYDVSSVRNSSTADVRTTIYWNPTVMIGESGETELEFYTADRTSTYDVVLEGVTTDGRVVRHVGIVERK